MAVGNLGKITMRHTIHHSVVGQTNLRAPEPGELMSEVELELLWTA